MKNIHDEPQFSCSIYEDGNRIDQREIDDPFIVTRVGFVLGRWDAFKAIFRPLVKRYEVRVAGTSEAYHVVFSGDYSPLPKDPSVSMGIEVSDYQR